MARKRSRPLAIFSLLEQNLDHLEPGTSGDLFALPSGPVTSLHAFEDVRVGLEGLERLLGEEALALEAVRPLPARTSVPEDAPSLGEYRLLGELGRGGMGIVYRAVKPGLDREVALKMLPPHISRFPERVERFRREAFLGARLSHPGIVRILDVCQHEESWFVVMELVEGPSLEALLQALRSAGTRRITRTHLDLLGATDVAARFGADAVRQSYVHHCAALIFEVARALAAAHAAGVLHRDLKPGNILLDPDNKPRITDFGLATQLDESSDRTTRMGLGTPLYMAPESFARQGQPRASQDVYSLGVVLYELLTLSPPFCGGSIPEVSAAVQTARVIPPSRQNPAVDPELEIIVMKSMERDPAMRYASAAEMAEDLEHRLQGRRISTVSPTRLAFLERRERLWRFWAIALAVLSVVLVLVLLFGIRR